MGGSNVFLVAYPEQNGHRGRKWSEHFLLAVFDHFLLFLLVFSSGTHFLGIMGGTKVVEIFITHILVFFCFPAIFVV